LLSDATLNATLCQPLESEAEMKTKKPPTALFFNYEVALQNRDARAARKAQRELKNAGFDVKRNRNVTARGKGGAM
jgi:hypothetical protein